MYQETVPLDNSVPIFTGVLDFITGNLNNNIIIWEKPSHLLCDRCNTTAVEWMFMDGCPFCYEKGHYRVV